MKRYARARLTPCVSVLWIVEARMFVCLCVFAQGDVRMWPVALAGVRMLAPFKWVPWCVCLCVGACAGVAVVFAHAAPGPRSRAPRTRRRRDDRPPLPSKPAPIPRPTGPRPVVKASRQRIRGSSRPFATSQVGENGRGGCQLSLLQQISPPSPLCTHTSCNRATSCRLIRTSTRPAGGCGSMSVASSLLYA